MCVVSLQSCAQRYSPVPSLRDGVFPVFVNTDFSKFACFETYWYSSSKYFTAIRLPSESINSRFFTSGTVESKVAIALKFMQTHYI